MKRILFLIFCPLLFLSCKGQEKNNVKKITAKELDSALKDKIQLVDVRTPAEFRQGHIKSAKNVDVSNADFEKRIQQLDKNKPIYVYCRSGHRSNMAARKMEKAGFSMIYDLKGGINAWSGETVQ
ncbi:rhodanese-like domain-containing protein [Flavobacterium salilacus subsp. salilacus]|uniref:rhodanese-like domain-containing protein n=1 Tax=Flavobacterium TaxID=237 RepID=UPI0010754A81|nr:MULTISPECIES: rhodanese-like domain-containing protein [Flavobacterium]KAF2519128.1 rhodanese-like domain-containing protein [Flavobacterium salilacus subsp. salilacus]MBE1613307.1 rhodanese-like domain-containing protein [Flavobacterium sp. SaA2.13]